jgi:hypothetical protein
VERRTQLSSIVAALAAASFLAACGDTGGGSLSVGGAAADGRVSGSDRSQPAGWAAPIQADTWTVPLEAGSAVTILLCSAAPSSAFDPYLQLDFMGQNVAMDDDSAGNLNARIVYTPTQSGAYDVYVTSHGGTAPAGGAAYTVRVLAGAMYEATCPTTGGP